LSLPQGEPRRPISYKDRFLDLIRPFVHLLSKMKVRPNTLTATGWALSVGAGVLFGLGYIKSAGALMLLAGLFDTLDGAVARHSGQTTVFGAFFDSTLDRLSESIIFMGIIYFYATAASPYAALLAATAMTFSLMTSYARARAEGLGYKCQVGLLERPGRVLILSIFSIFGFMTAGVAAVAAGAAITTVQRILHVRRLGS
jgi:CDP-diacylglycerol---glycerol-3-phosphate 3-phosphatidyltransferase